MKKAFFLLSIIISFFVIQGLVRSIITLWEKRGVYVSRQEELARVKKEHFVLKEQEKQVNDPQFAEKEIRNKLFLVKPDESVVVIPAGIDDETKPRIEKKAKEKPAYKQWLALFFSGKLE